ncbi:MAG TPA: alpha/beta fold hydrolase, partial [Ramlibacter sp.]
MKAPDAMSRSLKPSDLHAEGRGALRLAAHGYFFVAAAQARKDYGTIVAGQALVEYFIPERLVQPWPIVMVHGGGGQSLDLLATADGRPGWVQFFLAQGYAVYTLDRPGHGRSPYHPDALGPMSPPPPLEFLRSRFTHPEAARDAWPGADRHTRWPAGAQGEEALVNLAASCGPSQASFEAGHRAAADAGRELLQRIGPAILLTHSAGGPCGWVMADAAPGMVKGIVAIEPQGPPFLERPGAGRFDYGLAASPMAFEPPLREGEVLAGVDNPP